MVDRSREATHRPRRARRNSVRHYLAASAASGRTVQEWRRWHISVLCPLTWVRAMAQQLELHRQAHVSADDIEVLHQLVPALRNLSTVANSSWLTYPRARPVWPRGMLGTAWKCAWTYGISQCSVLFLTGGQPLAAQAAAQQWAQQGMQDGYSNSSKGPCALAAAE